MTYHPALRLTPSNSPFTNKPSTPRSPTKYVKTAEPGLHLTKVIGTTTASANAFDFLPSTRQFAFTAGAAAVLATIGDNLSITQHFYRAYPTYRDGGASGPLPQASNEAPRVRTLGNLKEQSSNASPLSASTRDWADSPLGRSATAKDRVKTATSVAISPNGKWLAVGETGYKPRILIFSTRDGSSEHPACVLAEHSFGVHALSFSLDSKFLASLGTVNDGFLYVWCVDDKTGGATLHSSNKCTTFIHSMCWMGQRIITAGLRYVKVWRPNEDSAASDLRSFDVPRGSLTPRQRAEMRSSDFGNSILSPKHKVLAGKNSLLGDLLECTFVTVLPISEAKALLFAESGEICLLDDSMKLQSVVFTVNAGMRISAARLDEAGLRLHVMGSDDQTASYQISELIEPNEVLARDTQGQSIFETKSGTPLKSNVIATGVIPGAIIEIRSDRTITLSALNSQSEIAQSRQLAAHQDSVLGVTCVDSAAIPEAKFMTFSSNGSLRLWDVDGASVCGSLEVPIANSRDMYGIANELRAAVILTDGMLAAAGDRYGTIILLDLRTRLVLDQVRAHASEILDLVVFERDGVHLLVSASRDRTLQLFLCAARKLELIQTMEEHAGAVTSLLMAQSNTFLLSCSADRSIVIREAMLRDSDDPKSLVYVMLRTVALKSAPSSICLGPDPGSFLVATMDRCVGKYSIRGGQAAFSFKCADSDSGEAVILSKISYIPALDGSPTIAGVSSSDKSVRLYSENGALIARDWGHAEGITSMILVPRTVEDAAGSPSPRIVTVAADSTIFIWESLVASSRPGSHSSEYTGVGEINGAPLAPPLRKVISHSELSRFRREKSTDDAGDMDPPSPTTVSTPVLSASPHRLRKKTSRMSIAQAPRLEPPHHRSGFDSLRRTSLRHRSPSPPSPRNHSKKETSRRPSLGMSLRSKSTDTVDGLNHANGAGFGSLGSSTDSVCRTLRAYRKKLAASGPNDSIGPDLLRELEKELKLTARVVGEKSQGKNLDEAIVTRLLERASDRIVGILDEKIKERVESEVRRNSDGLPSIVPQLDSPAELDEGVEHLEVALGATSMSSRANTS